MPNYIIVEDELYDKKKNCFLQISTQKNVTYIPEKNSKIFVLLRNVKNVWENIQMLRFQVLPIFCGEIYSFEKLSNLQEKI